MATLKSSCEGEKFGIVTAIKEYSLRKESGRILRMVDCLCDCGKNFTTQKGALRNGSVKSCGCARSGCRSVKVGDTFNSMTLISEPVNESKGKPYYAYFRCVCGNEKFLGVDNVKAGRPKSCGCENKKNSGPKVVGIPEENQDEVCNAYVAGATSPELAIKYGVSNDTVLRLLRIKNVEIRGKHDRYIRGDDHINRSRFVNLSCKENAYYYGLLLADGCLRGNTVTFSLNQKDGYLVHQLHSWLNAKTKVVSRARKDSRTGKTYYSTCMSFSDKVIADNLRSLGMTERKSTIEKLPYCFAHSPDFWRGMLDGDGFITDNANSVGLCGSKEICNGFLNYCKSLGALPTQEVKQRGRLFNVTLTGFDNCKLVLDEIYKNAEGFLLRKYNNYMRRYYKKDIENDFGPR